MSKGVIVYFAKDDLIPFYENDYENYNQLLKWLEGNTDIPFTAKGSSQGGQNIILYKQSIKYVRYV